VPRGGDTSAKARAAGKQVGRPPKPKIELKADKGVASTVLASIDEHAYWRYLLHADEMADEKKRALLTAKDRDEIKAVMVYLTDRRDGKPAQGVFVGDTRESARELDFGDLPELIAPGQSGTARKPN
jgi:hypothetical protein